MIGPWDLRGVLAILPTPAKEGADRWDATDTVNLDETARLVEQLIKDGVGGIIALGTMGECSTLSQADYEKFVDCVLATVRRRVPTFIGTTALGTHEVVRRIRFVRERGADGTLLGIPMWQPATLEMALTYYASIAEAFPDFAIMVYANTRAFRFDFGVEFWEQVVRRAPTVMSSKFSNRKILQEAIAVSGKRVNFVTNDSGAYAFAEISLETTTCCWMPSVGPQPGIALMNAVAARDMARAKEIASDIAWAAEPIHHIVTSPEIFASYNIQLEKILMEASGYCKPGPIRPPYNVIPKEYAEAAREKGRRSATLREKYAKLPPL